MGKILEGPWKVKTQVDLRIGYNCKCAPHLTHRSRENGESIQKIWGLCLCHQLTTQLCRQTGCPEEGGLIKFKKCASKFTKVTQIVTWKHNGKYSLRGKNSTQWCKNRLSKMVISSSTLDDSQRNWRLWPTLNKNK